MSDAGEHGAPLVLQHMEVWRDAVLASSPSDECTEIIDAHPCPRKLTKIDNATALWVTPAAILKSATALKQALGKAPARHRPQIDRLWISTRFVLLFNWARTCALARQQGVAWPVAPVMEAAIRDVEASLAAAQIQVIDWRRHNASWLRNGSKLNLSLRCE